VFRSSPYPRTDRRVPHIRPILADVGYHSSSPETLHTKPHPKGDSRLCSKMTRMNIKWVAQVSLLRPGVPERPICQEKPKIPKEQVCFRGWSGGET
jgi:hypothetical protein